MTTQHDTVRILFVCLGNICRSPMAEAVMRAEVQARGLADSFDIASCGTGRWNIGNPPHAGTRRILDDAGISYEGQRAKTMTHDEISSYDYIIAMDQSNVSDLQAMGVDAERIRLLTDFIGDDVDVDVPDPYYHGNFEHVYELIQTGVAGILAEILAG